MILSLLKCCLTVVTGVRRTSCINQTTATFAFVDAMGKTIADDVVVGNFAAEGEASASSFVGGAAARHS